MRGALLDRDGVLLLLDEEALYKKALELAAYGAGLDKKSFRSLPSSKSTRLAKRLSERLRL